MDAALLEREHDIGHYVYYGVVPLVVNLL